MEAQLILILFISLFSMVYSEVEDLGTGYYENKNESNKIHPCANSDDKTACCISYIKDHSDSSGVPAQEPLFREFHTIYLPAMNCTLDCFNGTVYGLKDGFFEDCYYNKETGNFVTLITFAAPTIKMEVCYFMFHRKGQEDIRVPSILDATYPHSLTTISRVSESGAIDLKSTRFRCDIPHYPEFYASDTIMNSEVPQVYEPVNYLKNNMQVAVAETFLTECRTFWNGYMLLHGINYEGVQTAISNRDALRT